MLLGKTIVITGISSGIGARVGELAQALGADVIGVDINEPARPLDAFIKADIGSAQGVAEIIQTLPQRFDALCNVAGVSGMIGAAKTLAINFYGLRELSEAAAPRLREGGAVVNVASIAGYGWRANLERAKSVRRRTRVSGSRRAPCGAQGAGRRGLSAVEGALAPVDDAGRASAAVQGPGRAGQCGQPRPGDDADPEGVSLDLRRSASRRRHRARRPRRLGARHRRACALPLLGRRALDQRRQPAGRRRPRSLDQCECSWILNSADVPVTGAFASEAAASEADAVKAVKAAAHAFPAWSETGTGERRAFLLKAAG
jgi:NAD(P)-dependent dehydrogenase (short-subunit alcohol dehydrogenase family)